MNRLESTVLQAIRLSADRWGESAIPMTLLQEKTGYGRTSLSKAVSSLSNLGYIQVTRTKRNFGKLYFNKYRILK
jgi:DNA-binding MarR family transcriptional regulator